ncbi:MAG TPA: pitrilysin family protein, partial [Acidobacteriota bacterium]
FPMATAYFSQIDKEMTVFVGTTHKDNLTQFYGLLRDAVLEPAFLPEDFQRLREDQKNFVAKTLRFSDDEELGKTILSWAVFQGHPYSHPNAGTVKGNAALSLQDVKDFYKIHYTRSNLLFGISGNFSDDLVAQIKKDFAALPEGDKQKKEVPMAAKLERIKVILTEKQTPATAISFGFPISFTRSDEDFYPMMIANSWLGQHRNEFSHLYQVMREARGMNYGDYSYIEHFAFGGQFMQPPPNYARSRQIFQIWIRPVPNAIRHFALRQAVRELQMLIEQGMSEQQFELTRKFLTNYSPNLAQTNSQILGYALDDKFYGLKEPFLERIKKKFASLTVGDVNAAIRKHLNTKNIMIAIVTQDSQSFRKDLVANVPSPIKYETPKPEAILQEDKIIQDYPLNVSDSNVTIIPADQIFE